ncbi:GNAT family N-acetyltransferase [Flavobacterium sp. N1719]|uniref:GNAT family N-acetyltransferase n=1 Tax=Flavobacterium sp. N1719 TaxID=2885633 RepID=UPI0022218BBE|nr:GNAT family N-acetyltransferase [Flavobacterium sp. N1719]
MNIRIATTQDCLLIQSLAATIWPVAYRTILSKEQLDYMLDKFYTPTALEQQMEQGQVFFILEENSEALGFAAVALHEKPNIAKLHKLYVLSHLQGKGWGRILLEHCCAYALQHHQQSIFLNVNRFNKALTFYEKFGFTCIETVDIPIGNGYFMEDFVMEKRL